MSWYLLNCLSRAIATLADHRSQFHSRAVFQVIAQWGILSSIWKHILDERLYQRFLSNNLSTSITLYHFHISHDVLIYSGRVNYIFASKTTTISSYISSSTCRRQAITWTNAVIILFWTLGTHLCEIHTFSVTTMHFKVSYAQWRGFYFGLNVSIKHIYRVFT